MEDLLLPAALVTVLVVCLSVALAGRRRFASTPQPDSAPPQPDNTPPPPHPLFRFRDREASSGFPTVGRFLAAKRELPRPNELGAEINVAGKVGEVGELLVDVCGRWEEYFEAKRALMRVYESGVFRATEDSLLAQWEALHLLLHTLQTHHSSHFAITPIVPKEGEGGVAPPPLAPHAHHHILVKINGVEFTTMEYAQCPLKLASLLVQEDLCIMREDVVGDAGQQRATQGMDDNKARGSAEGPTNKTHTLTAASVCFSFALATKFNKPMGQIHTPVGGFKRFLQSPMNRFFASLRSRVVWRSNWSVRVLGSLVAKSVFVRSLAELHKDEPQGKAGRSRLLAPGTRVEVLSGGRGGWSRAVIVAPEPAPAVAGACSVVLESGERQDGVDADWVSPLHLPRGDFAKGTRVSVDWKRAGVWYPGVVVAVAASQHGGEKRYGVAFDDGDFEDDVRAEDMRPLCDNPTTVFPLGCDVEVEVAGRWHPGHITGVHCAECTHPHRPTPSRLPPPHHAFHSGLSAQWDSPSKERTYDVRLGAGTDVSEKNLGHVPRHRLRDAVGTFGPPAPEDHYLMVEYQTLQRMPVSNHILFTVRSYFEPLSSLACAPEAAGTLAKEMSHLYAPFAAYKGLDDDHKRDQLVSYLRSLAPQSAATP